MTEAFRDSAEQRLDRMLTQPFRKNDLSYAIGQREDASRIQLHATSAQ